MGKIDGVKSWRHAWLFKRSESTDFAPWTATTIGCLTNCWSCARPVNCPKYTASTAKDVNPFHSANLSATLQHLFVPHRTPEPLVFLRPQRNARPQPCVRIWTVERTNVEDTKRMKMRIFHDFSLVGLVWPLWNHFGRNMSFILALTWTSVFVVLGAPSHTNSQHHVPHISTFPHKMLLALCSVAPKNE